MAGTVQLCVTIALDPPPTGNLILLNGAANAPIDRSGRANKTLGERQFRENSKESFKDGKVQTLKRYATPQIVLHWISAVLVTVSLLFGTLVLKHLPNDPGKITALRVHMIIGAVIGGVIVLRLLLRLLMPQPERATTGSALLDRLASLTHGAMYLGVIGMVASGIALAVLSGLPAAVFSQSAALPEDFWQFPPRYVHAVFASILIGLVGLHVLAALFHQFVRKDRLLARMWWTRG